MPSTPSPDSDYRFAPVVGVRLVGGLLVGLALLLLAVTVVVTVLGGPLGVLLVITALGVVVLGVGYVAIRRVSVVHLGAEGYRVRLVRGVGVAAASWRQVDQAATTTVAGSPVVLLRLTDGGTTTIPVTVLACDREDFVRDLRAHLQHGQGLRPLS